MFRRDIFAVVDQGIVSLGNFATAVFLARVLAPIDYGTFAALFGAILLFNTLHSAVVTYPLFVDAATLERRHVGQRVGGQLVITAALGILEVGTLAAYCVYSGRPQFVVPSAAALLCWQLQETCRRGLLAKCRFAETIWGDTVSYVGQFAFLCVIHAAAVLTIEHVFWVVAATSAAGLLIQARQVGICVPSSHLVFHAWSHALRLGKWTTLTNVLVMLQSIPMCVWLLDASSSARNAAALQACGNILGLSHPLLFTVATIIVPTVAQVCASTDVAAAWRAALRRGLQIGLIVVPFYIVVALFPQMALRLFYGNGTIYLPFAWAVRALAFTYVALFIAQLGAAFLLGIERVKNDFLANAMAFSFGAAGFWLAFNSGAMRAALIGLAVAISTRTIILLAACLGIVRTEATAVASVPVLQAIED